MNTERADHWCVMKGAELTHWSPAVPNVPKNNNKNNVHDSYMALLVRYLYYCYPTFVCVCQSFCLQSMLHENTG